jgi:hypothetical protein
MTRLLLATCQLLFASSAFAKSPAQPATDAADGSAKPGKVVSPNNDADPNAPQHPAVVPPARAAAPLPTRGGAPRWHSLLPGMIR